MVGAAFGFRKSIVRNPVKVQRHVVDGLDCQYSGSHGLWVLGSKLVGSDTAGLADEENQNRKFFMSRRYLMLRNLIGVVSLLAVLGMVAPTHEASAADKYPSKTIT